MIRRKLFCLVFLGFLFPSFGLHCLDIRETYPVLRNFSPEGDVTSPFDLGEFLQFIEDITSDEFEGPSTPEEEEFILNLIIKLARLGTPENDIHAREQLERDIEELLASEE